MKRFLLLLSIFSFLISCTKKTDNTCKDCDIVRQFDVNTILPQKYGQDTIFVYDIITMNYCSNKTKHYLFETDIYYKNKMNECLSISCSTDSTGIQQCAIK
jgi:hypothetical protein